MFGFDSILVTSLVSNVITSDEIKDFVSLNIRNYLKETSILENYKKELRQFLDFISKNLNIKIDQTKDPVDQIFESFDRIVNLYNQKKKELPIFLKDTIIHILKENQEFLFQSLKDDLIPKALNYIENYKINLENLKKFKEFDETLKINSRQEGLGYVLLDIEDKNEGNQKAPEFKSDFSEADLLSQISDASDLVGEDRSADSDHEDLGDSLLGAQAEFDNKQVQGIKEDQSISPYDIALQDINKEFNNKKKEQEKPSSSFSLSSIWAKVKEIAGFLGAC
jgi:hypothetical protein